MGYLESYQEWLTNPYFDAETRAELEAIRDDDKEIKERFYADLEFGTGGLRGIIGAGTNRMNKYVVRKATQGMANFIKKQGTEAMGVAIAHDSRRMSTEFADEAALTLAANGIRAYVFDTLRPTPELSFAVRYYGCTAGINVTASHNPPEYNGYKAYWADGAQITPPYDTGIMDEVKAVTNYADCKTMDKAEAKAAGLYVTISVECDAAYMRELKKQIKRQDCIDAVGKDITVVYNPLHGAGNVPVRRILAEIGFPNVYVVPEQELPDGNFPTVSYPNPEAAECFELALKLAKEKNADLVLATDPDSDRLGVYVKDAAGEYQCLTGNMSGCLLADYEISQWKEQKGLPADGALISTIVSTNLAGAIAKKYGVEFIETLTGFKYIGEQIKKFEDTGKGTFLFGFEESYGCLIGTHARDKDAVVASMALCEAAAYYKTQGKTLWDAMLDIYNELGYYKDNIISITLKGLDGLEKIQKIMSVLREEEPKTLGAYRVLAKRDYKLDTVKDMETGAVTATGLPNSNVLYYDLEDNAWCCVRPSGTEPKIKLYYGVKGSSFEDAAARSEALGQVLSDMVNAID
ncbi:MAG: phospho-sugar mutase [Lachnospiraceae bacterium]|nr:phospho-sugar mutase [Lachnospiraceae bacterium]